ncbi:MAG TPA: tetratricopeptide repeat protein [Chryseosolibacter sp.]
MRLYKYILLLCSFFTSAYVFAQQQQAPRKAFEMLEEAESIYSDGRYDAALKILDECLKQYPGYMDAYALRGNVRESLKDNDGALTDYSIFLEKFPQHGEILLNRAVIRYRVGFYEQAIEDFKTILTLPAARETNSLFFKKSMSVDDRNPIITTTEGGNHRSYILNYIGLAELKRKNAQQAKLYFDSAIHLDAREPDYFVNRGLAKEAMSDSTALLDYEQALRLNKNHTLAKHNLDAVNARRLKSMSIEERLSQTIQADSTMLYPYLERAQQRYEAEYYQGAMEDYTSALEIDSTNVEVWLGRGLAKEKMKDFKGAFSDYTKAIDIKENFAKAWLNRGNVLLKMERYEDAIEDYNVAIIYYPDYSIAFYNRAMAKIKLKKNAEACDDLTKAEQFGMKVDAKVKTKTCSK